MMHTLASQKTHSAPTAIHFASPQMASDAASVYSAVCKYVTDINPVLALRHRDTQLKAAATLIMAAQLCVPGDIEHTAFSGLVEIDNLPLAVHNAFRIFALTMTLSPGQCLLYKRLAVKARFSGDDRVSATAGSHELALLPFHDEFLPIRFRLELIKSCFAIARFELDGTLLDKLTIGGAESDWRQLVKDVETTVQHHADVYHVSRDVILAQQPVHSYFPRRPAFSKS